VKQVTHRLADGRVDVLDVPVPELRPEGVLVDVRASVVSVGTERRTLEAGRRGLLGKARARPDQVRRVVDKARREGVGAAAQAVRFRLGQASPLGYSASGVVLAAGARVSDLAPGDRVACGGAGYANHAEVDSVPANLAVRVPEGVSFEQAAFATVGAIALHAVRQADVRIGERVAVVGVGLVGRLAAQILRAAGCRVVGIDLEEGLVRGALAAGDVHAGFPRSALDGPLPAEAGDCDAVLVTAAGGSADPVQLAGRLCRDRGRVVVVGDVDVELSREAWYGKELELVVSRSSGPGRYDAEYEQRGLDYPIGYVRWTERRNMAAFLDLVADGSVRVDGLVTERVPVDRAPEALEALLGGGASPLGVVIEYEASEAPAPSAPRPLAAAPGRPLAAGLVGAGGHVGAVLAPALRRAGFDLEAIASAGGLSAHSAAGRLGVRRVLGVDELLGDPDVGLVVVASRHDTHAELAARALAAGKAAFLEKPAALTGDSLAALAEARRAAGRPLVVGFNRRHAPLVRALRDALPPGVPRQLLVRVNAPLEAGHWLDDPVEGGGRLLGDRLGRLLVGGRCRPRSWPEAEHELGEGRGQDDEEQDGDGDGGSGAHGYEGPWSVPVTVAPGGTSVTAEAGSNAHSAAAEPRSRASEAKPYESTTSTSSDGLASAYVCTQRTERTWSPNRTSSVRRPRRRSHAASGPGTSPVRERNSRRRAAVSGSRQTTAPTSASS